MRKEGAAKRMKGKRQIWIILCLVLTVLTACGKAGRTQNDQAVKDAAEENDTGTDSMSAGIKDPQAAGLQPDGNASASGEEEPAESGGQPGKKERIRAGQGMKLSILGDSISTYGGWIPEGNNVFYVEGDLLDDVSQTWWKIVLDELGLTLCGNGSSSMSACFGDSKSQDHMVGTTDLRISQLTGENGETPDIIIVYMGSNDMINSIPIGDNDGLRTVEEGYVDNFSDAYSLMLDKLEEAYPAAQIYCCTILPMGDWGTEEQPFVPFVNGLGLTSKPYADQIRVIAGSRGIPVIDLYNCGITLDNMPQMTFDGVHPKPEGMRCIADLVRKCITE